MVNKAQGWKECVTAEGQHKRVQYPDCGGGGDYLNNICMCLKVIKLCTHQKKKSILWYNNLENKIFKLKKQFRTLVKHNGINTSIFAHSQNLSRMTMKEQKQKYTDQKNKTQ